ncbi:MAG TPA: tetratricopeptide repeat protein, partial [Planctomycetota bacterium]|nr:tetratricopeptide repeat protein [Planctomycetota bacterium]
MREWILAGAALALVAAGCSSAPPAGQQPATQAPAAEKPAAQPVSAPGGGVQAQGAEWEQLIQKLKASYEVTQAAMTSQADEHYRLAERYYQAGDYEKAAVECEKALQINGNHAPARALHLEVEFLLGRGKVNATSMEYDRYMREALVRHQQTLVEIDNAMASGQRLYNLGEYDKAEREFRKILEYAKWMPTGIELETRRRQALDMLDRSKGSRRQRDLDEEKERLKRIEEERARDDYKRAIDQKRELELLFGQAQMYFEREQYDRCIEICNKILYINPNLTSVSEMQNVAMRLNHMMRNRDNLRNYIEEWKRTFEQIELNAAVQADVLEFPDMETWKEIISKRRPKGIAELEEDIKPEDKEILDKLKSIRITIDMQNAPLTAIIDYIREISGLNMHISGVDNADSEMISFKVADIVLDGALRLMLGPRQLAYVVRDGVVLITKQDQLKKQVKLELYDVQDLTYGMKDFPGVDISLAQNAIGTTVSSGDEESKNFTGEDLANLIKNSVHKGEWEEADGKSIQFQNGLLIVRNSVEMHRNVRKFLSDLRASTSMLVAVQVRFLSVEQDFLQEVGMDFRDVNGARVQGISNLGDINPIIAGVRPQFIAPGGGLNGQTAGITGVFGNAVQQSLGARVQQIMTNDFLLNKFFNTVLGPLGGATLQYTLLDKISIEM